MQSLYCLIAAPDLNGDFIRRYKDAVGFTIERVLQIYYYYKFYERACVTNVLQVFHTDQEEMVTHLEQGDVAETVRVFFEQSSVLPPQKKSLLSLQQVTHNSLHCLNKQAAHNTKSDFVSHMIC